MAEDGDRITTFLCVTWVLLLVAVVYLTVAAADRKLVPMHTMVLVMVGGFSLLAIVAVAPLDVAYTLGTRLAADGSGRRSRFESHSRILQEMYAAVYWAGLVVSIVVLPFVEEYNASGRVQTLARCFDALQRLGAMALALGAAFVVVLAIILSSGEVDSSQSAQVSLIAMANTANSVVLAVLLGVGLVEVPRACYVKSEPRRELEKAYATAAAEFASLKEASVAASKCAADALLTLEAVEKLTRRDEAVRRHAAKGSFGDRLGAWLDEHCFGEASLERCAEALREDCAALREAGFRSAACGEVRAGRFSDTPDARSVATARRELARARAWHAAALGAVDRVKARVFYLEDVLAAGSDTKSPETGPPAAAVSTGVDRPWRERTLKWSFGRPPSGAYGWLWHCRVRPKLHRALSLSAAIFSACLVTSQLGAVIQGRPGLQTSAFAAMVRSAARNSGDAAAAVAASTCLAYAATCAARALALLKVRGLFEVNLHRRTPPRVLSFTTRQAGKLAPPLIYNFFATLHEVGTANPGDAKRPPPYGPDDDDGSNFRTAFDRFYSAKLDSLTPGFDKIAAILVLILAALHAVNALNRLLVCCKLGAYQFGADVAAVDESAKQDGRRRLEADRKRLEAAAKRTQLRAKAAAGGTSSRSPSVDPAVADDDAFGRKQSSVRERRGLMELASSSSSTKNVVRHDQDDNTQQPLEGRRRVQTTAPRPRRGWLAKQPGRGSTGIWRRRLFVLREPGELAYFKTQATDRPVGVVDLRLVLAVHLNGDNRVDLELPDRRLTLEAADESDASDWANAVDAWRRYAAERDVRSAQHYDEDDVALKSENNDEKPEPLEGPVDVKRGRNYRLDDWIPHYFRLDHRGLCVFAHATASDPIRLVDLRLVADVARRGFDPACVSVDDLDFRAADPAAAERWIQALEDWKDYLLLHHTSSANMV